MNLKNSGLVQQKLWDPKLRILGIRKGVSLHFRAKDPYRMEFPEKVLPLRDILPGEYNFFFVEPGVHQDISYVTKVSSSIQQFPEPHWVLVDELIVNSICY